VGNTMDRYDAADTLSVHPHIRGEYCILWRSAFSSAGSPPHTWGIQWLVPKLTAFTRFTPTYVGNTTMSVLKIIGRSVHPHIRGEYDLRSTATLARTGSPPHTWGILDVPLTEPSSQRFTPTYVGNTRLV